MSNWREPITDRTIADVKNYDAGSLEYQKGALNADDLNRIEGNFAYLEEKLRSDAIFIPHIFRNCEETTLNADGTQTTNTYTDWQENNLPWLSEINRIRANHNALVRLFLVGLGFSEQPESNYLDYNEVNNWEKFALFSKMMFENMEKEYLYCGMEESGGERLL